MEYSANKSESDAPLFKEITIDGVTSVTLLNPKNNQSEKQQKLDYGAINELRLMKWLNQKYPKYGFVLASNQFDSWDFRCKNAGYTNRRWEVKSRKEYHDGYPTTMIGRNKWDKAINDFKSGSKNTYRVFWLYLDGLYSYKFNMDDIDKKKIVTGWWSGKIDGVYKKSEVYYIPKDMMKLEDASLCSYLEDGDKQPQPHPIDFSFCLFSDSDEE